MRFFESDSQSYYETLDLSPDASQNDIRQAYLRAKAAYSKDSAAIYSLFDADETRHVLERIEQAFLVLSNPEKRKEYDRVHGFFSASNAPSLEEKASQFEDPLPFASESMSSSKPEPSPRLPTDSRLVIPKKTELDRSFTQNPEMEAAIQGEQEFSGAFLKQVREYRNLSLDDVCGYTKISKNYLNCIESEDYSGLPAAAYVRGFIVQIARAIKIPQDLAAKGYIARFNSKAPAAKVSPK